MQQSANPKRINVGKLAEASVVDGPGLRTVVWLQGCNLRCPGCQNKELWDRAPGNWMRTEYLVHTLSTMNALGECSGNSKFTITGGEPFSQLRSLHMLVLALSAEVRDPHIILYTGYTWEELRRMGLIVRSVLEHVDILVDGRYDPDLDDDWISYRGSRNQRVILTKQSLASGELVTTNWDGPMGTIRNGNITLPGALAEAIDPQAAESDRCGQYKEGS